MKNLCIKCPCIKCSYWDSDIKECIIPQSDMRYACPIKLELSENKKALEKYVKWTIESEK